MNKTSHKNKYLRNGDYFVIIPFCSHSVLLTNDAKNGPVRAPYKYTLLDGLAYNTRGYFASCVVFFRAPQGRGKM